MALTNVDKRLQVARKDSTHRQRVVQVTFDNSYTTNGMPFTAADANLKNILWCSVAPAGGYVFEYDYTNSKIIAYRQKDPAAAGGADIPLPQVANGIDLSLIITRAHVIGE